MMNKLSGAIEQTLRNAGGNGAIRQIERIGGGDINEAARVDTETGRYFVKWHSAPPHRFFICEADGLRLLGGSGVVRVPEVIGHGVVEGSSTAFLVLEWIEQVAGKSSAAAERLGRQLAEMHRLRQPHYGLDNDNYIGRLAQSNTRYESWIAFYRDQRLWVQRDLAVQQGNMPPHREKMLDALMENLHRWIDESQCQPSLLHGDLWGGNWMVAPSGDPVLIDPAVYYGDREADLAMTALFGGFPARFYSAYEEVFPLEAGHRPRQPLYQLYYLLCHLNLFGETYGGSVDTVLRQLT
jgi:fructosamine-3-kinase